MSIFNKIKLFGSINKEKPKDLNNIIETSENPSRELTPEEKDMLNNVIGFGESRVEDCMVPRADIVGLEININIKEILKTFSDSNHSRIPIDIEKFLREILFVPPSMKSRDLLVRMQTSRIHMALVIDEYGGTDGLVTIEDLIEEIIGEIEDELFEEDLDRIKIYDNYIDTSARTSIEEINDIIGDSLYTEDTDEEINTIGGLVFILAGRVPQRGELIDHPLGFEIEITDADSRRIKTVRLRIKVDKE